MKLNKNMNILIVGLGLLGGSYAKALSDKGYNVSAVTKLQDSVDYAIENSMISKGSTEVNRETVGEADLIIFALYPTVFIDWIEKNQQFIKSGAIITDVTGVKGSVVYKIQDMLRSDVEYISAHPMAGKEVSGVANSDPKIFNNANYIVVPTEKNTANAIELCESLGYELGFYCVTQLSVEKHDEMIAFLSQLTHCIAVSLMCAKDDEGLVSYTGDSFRDLTRIGKINDEMWSELFLMNREPLLREIEAFENSFSCLKQALISNDRETLRKMMRISTVRRKRFDKRG
ncbi:MAG: prephenate dehydrogenase [Clostridia bacterium]|nr:prephenate dehydrogenase [Clostridia bacterium]